MVSVSRTRVDDLSTIDGVLQQHLPTLIPDRTGRGRPEILPAAMLWGALCLSVLNRDPSQRSIWRMVSASGLWDYGAVSVTAEAVRKRLVAQGPMMMEQVHASLTRVLEQQFPGDTTLIPEVPGVYAIDGSTLDTVVRILPEMTQRKHPPLAGKLHAAFDLRRQLFTKVIVTEDATANEKAAAQDLVQFLPRGSLLLMDQGYIKFEWLDDLTTAGYRFLIRYNKTFEERHVFTETAGVRDALGFCGKYRADRGGEQVRLVTITLPSGAHRTYLTNLTDPTALTPHMIATLYARRWDVEMAFRCLKTELNLHHIWSTTFAMNLNQVWATLVIFQIVSTMRMELARRAQVDLFDVSLRLLITDLHRYVAAGIPDILGYIASRPKYGGIIRPSRRIRITLPRNLPIIPAPPGLPHQRLARYANKPRGNKPVTRN